MRTIHKYPVALGEISTFEIPASAVPVHFGIDHRSPGYDDLAIWFDVETRRDRVPRQFVALGTGREIGPNWQHIGTVCHGGYVWHAFEVPPALANEHPVAKAEARGPMTEVPPGHFRCGCCGEVFEKGQPDEDAVAESRENFPGMDPLDLDQMAIVCDDCFNVIMADDDVLLSLALAAAGFAYPPEKGDENG